MSELRWVLLALGALLVVALYFFGRGAFRRSPRSRIRSRRRTEPRLSPEEDLSSEDVLFARPGEEPQPRRAASLDPLEPFDSVDAIEADASAVASPEGEAAQAQPEQPKAPEKIVAIRFVPKALELDAEEAVLALRDAGLRHGRYGIFHLHDEACPDEAQFSVASLTEPGSFDLQRLAEKPLAGMSFFMVLPGPGDPVDRFDRMVETARSLAHTLDAELFDDRGSSWSIQRERYIREELIRYRHEYVTPQH